MNDNEKAGRSANAELLAHASGSGTILLVEDNKKILAANKRILESRGHRVLCAETLTAARELLQTEQPDVAVLDIMLPDGDGLAFFKEMRDGQDAPLKNTPVIFLTGKGESEDILEGLDAGGNDYITKPYKIAEFCARVQSTLSWQQLKREEMPQAIVKGLLTLEVSPSRALFMGNDLDLKDKEFDLLFLLVQNEGRVLSAEYIYEKVWLQPMAGDKNAVRVAITRFRKKIEPAGYDIFTVRGRGYVFDKIESYYGRPAE